MTTTKTNPSSRRRAAIMAACLLMIAVAAAIYMARRGPVQAQTSAPIPPTVTAASASRADVPIWLTGLGTVQATLTVGIHAQVDGKLHEVLFKEGQKVKKGDVLAKIDPRLYQASMDQVKAKKAQDVAQLASFEKD